MKLNFYSLFLLCLVSFASYSQIGNTKFEVIKARGNNFELDIADEDEHWVKYRYDHVVEDFQFLRDYSGKLKCTVWILTMTDKNVLNTIFDKFRESFNLVKMQPSIWIDENQYLKFETTQQWGTNDFNITVTKWNGE